MGHDHEFSYKNWFKLLYLDRIQAELSNKLHCIGYLNVIMSDLKLGKKQN